MNRFGNGVGRTRDDFPTTATAAPFGRREVDEDTARFLAGGGRIELVPLSTDRVEAVPRENGSARSRYTQPVGPQSTHAAERRGRKGDALGGRLVLPGSHTGPKPIRQRA